MTLDTTPDVTGSDATNATSGRTPGVVVTAFFDAYRRHDVDGMVDLCSDNAEFSYVPFEAWGKQRVLRGDGKVRTIGKAIWAGLIHAFPDLTVDVHAIAESATGDVVAEVTIGGTQALPWGAIANRGRHYDEPHLFVFRVADGAVDGITAYWDGAGISRQLGHLEVD
ncbi:nuclear transport factor 2 family protein [Pseudonocardia sp. D17]|jgi:ketosteroid isomerase-like protein|uniref:nuclear transport factor 2 family protein n=1 Tax=Pseudonocardia sp. D17 TaxID=882661 RepID=UPI002B365490|nr:hypothetical protein PSD17_50120 [Pseudonocardia sp. D17]